MPESESGQAHRLVLASASPRRLELLKQIGVTPDDIIPADLDETALTGELPRPLAERLATSKSEAVFNALQQPAFVLAADTVVAVGRRILDKAVTKEDAKRFLELMSGRAHRVYTGLSIRAPDGRHSSRVVCSRVCFKRLTQAEIQLYLESGEWDGKAGGYAIQGLAAAFVTNINGSYSSIVGLPLYECAMVLRGLGYPALAKVDA